MTTPQRHRSIMGSVTNLTRFCHQRQPGTRRSGERWQPHASLRESAVIRWAEACPARGRGRRYRIGSRIEATKLARWASGAAARANPPLHPFLFAAASVLAQLAGNPNQIAPRDVVGALVGVLAFAAAVYFGVGALRRRRGAAAAVIASIWVVGCLFYAGLFGRFNMPLGGEIPSGSSLVRVLPLALAGLAVLTFAATRLGRAAVAVHTLLNGMALVMVATPVWQAVAWEMRHGPARAVYDADRAAAEMPQIATAGPGSCTAAGHLPLRLRSPGVGREPGALLRGRGKDRAVPAPSAASMSRRPATRTT